MDNTAYEHAWAYLNEQCKQGEITTDELLVKRKELQAQRDGAKAEAREAAVATKTQARVADIHAGQTEALDAQDKRRQYLERCHRSEGNKLRPSDYVASAVLLKQAKEMLDAAARLMGVAE